VVVFGEVLTFLVIFGMFPLFCTFFFQLSRFLLALVGFINTLTNDNDDVDDADDNEPSLSDPDENGCDEEEEEEEDEEV